MKAALPHYIPGDPWSYCDICGFKVRMSTTMKTWDGLRVCPEDYEERHPLDMVKGKAERMAVKDARPRPKEVHLSSPTTKDDY